VLGGQLDVDLLPGVRRRVRRNVRLDATAAAVDIKRTWPPA